MAETDSSLASVTELAKACMTGFKASWALFKHGTVVVAQGATNESEAKEKAVALIKEYGPVLVGCPAGDFTVVNVKAGPGWMITSHHDRIVTFVSRDQFGEEPNDMEVGFFGRNGRDLDSKELEIVLVHVEIEPASN